MTDLLLMNENILKTIADIRELRKSHNFQTIRKNLGEDKLRNFFTSIYPAYDLPQIEKITGVPDSSLAYWFDHLNIPFTRKHVTNVSIPGNFDSTITVSEGDTAKKLSVVNITPELAYLIGFTLGDGSTQRYMVEVFNKDRKLRKHLFEILKPYGPITEDERDNGLWRLRLSSGKIANIIRDKNVIRKDTLDYIFNNDVLAKQFIAAFWDAEGSIGRRKKYFDVILYNSNVDILSRIRQFLADKNIQTSLHHFKETRDSYFIGGRKVAAKKKVFRIRILKDSLLKWANLIGIHLFHSKKSNTIKELMKVYGGKQNE